MRTPLIFKTSGSLMRTVTIY